MPHVSKRKLDKQQLSDLYAEFIHTLERSAKRGDLDVISYQFFTKTEREMYAKRLAVISMLSQGVPIYDIAELLSMSPSTIDLMSLQFEMGNYSNVVNRGLEKTNIGDVIRKILTVGGIMPPIGRGRWKSLDNSLRRERIEKRLIKIAERKIDKKSKTKKKLTKLIYDISYKNNRSVSTQKRALFLARFLGRMMA
ncbi:MAG: hypothetical protein ABIF06_00575 [bacterium]